jgi:hypothetical protein
VEAARPLSRKKWRKQAVDEKERAIGQHGSRYFGTPPRIFC